MPSAQVRHSSPLSVGLLCSLGLAFSCCLWSGSAASASVLHQAKGVEVRVWKGETNDLQECVRNARDGKVAKASSFCSKIKASSDTLELDKVNVWIRKGRIFTKPFFAEEVTVSVSGKNVRAISNCLQDAKDGVLDNSAVCSQVAMAGSLIIFIDVAVTVHG
ncbi:MAG: hypothetical protein QG608_1514 [Actinomycetota bacterium]|nr:hypothetical protein [Actinomycetota bacterium]